MANSAIQGSTLIDFPAGMIMPFAGTTTPAGWLECDGSEVDINKYPTLAATLGVTWNTAKNPLTGVNHAAPAAGKFRVPDMRGSFLRGSSQGSNNAQGVSTALAEFQSQKTRKNGLDATAASSSVSGTTNIGHSHGASSVTGNTNSSGSHGHSQGSIVINGLVLGFNNQPPNNGGGSGVYSPPISYGSTSGGSGKITTTGSSNHSHGSSYTAAGQSLGTSNISLSSGSATAQAITVGDGDSETRPDAVGVRYLIKY